MVEGRHPAETTFCRSIPVLQIVTYRATGIWGACLQQFENILIRAAL